MNAQEPRIFLASMTRVLDVIPGRDACVICAHLIIRCAKNNGVCVCVMFRKFTDPCNTSTNSLTKFSARPDEGKRHRLHNTELYKVDDFVHACAEGGNSTRLYFQVGPNCILLVFQITDLQNKVYAKITVIIIFKSRTIVEVFFVYVTNGFRAENQITEPTQRSTAQCRAQSIHSGNGTLCTGEDITAFTKRN